MENLKTTKSRAKEISAMTLQKISELEEKLADLNQEYKALSATIQTCQSKYLTIEDEVLINLIHLINQISWDMLDKLEHWLVFGLILKFAILIQYLKGFENMQHTVNMTHISEFLVVHIKCDFINIF